MKRSELKQLIKEEIKSIFAESKSPKEKEVYTGTFKITMIPKGKYGENLFFNDVYYVYMDGVSGEILSFNTSASGDVDGIYSSDNDGWELAGQLAKLIQRK